MLSALLDQHKPDIVCFQEITPDHILHLQQIVAIQTQYSITSIQGQMSSYKTCILSQVQSVTCALKMVDMPGSARKMIVGHYALKDKVLSVASVHLQSEANMEVFRQKQLNFLDGTLSKSDLVIVAGDFNFADPEEEDKYYEVSIDQFNQNLRL